MADIINGVFRRKKADFLKLIAFGFRQKGDIYEYSRVFTESGFVMTVTVTKEGAVSANITDPAFGEQYTLHLSSAAGDFVGNIRCAYEETLTNIAEQCFEPDVFKSAQAKELIACVKNEYGDELEFLWEKFPDNAIWRREDTNKWYGALLTVSKRKLGLASDEMAEIIDLRIKPDDLEVLIDNKKYFLGYHMNKKNWYTIILDGSVETGEICRRIAESYALAVK